MMKTYEFGYLREERVEPQAEKSCYCMFVYLSILNLFVEN
jgi:hypothetical protein